MILVTAKRTRNRIGGLGQSFGRAFRKDNAALSIKHFWECGTSVQITLQQKLQMANIGSNTKNKINKGSVDKQDH